jgi:hypothetical protein
MSKENESHPNYISACASLGLQFQMLAQKASWITVPFNGISLCFMPLRAMAIGRKFLRTSTAIWMLM